MTHFRDFEPCDYQSDPPLHWRHWSVPLRAIGWLQHPHPFETGVVPEAFVARFEVLSLQMRACFAQYAFRGLHSCDLCMTSGADRAPPIDGSNVNVLVPGEDVVFAATGGLLHYVRMHGYRPPQAFVDAVMACPPCDSPAYLEALRVANDDHEPPLETWVANLERSHREQALHVRFMQLLGKPIRDATRDQVAIAARLAWPALAQPDDASKARVGEFLAVFDHAGGFRDFEALP